METIKTESPPDTLADKQRFGGHGENIVAPILQADGTLAAGAECPMDDDQVQEVLSLMIRSRLIDERGVSYQRQGRIGTFSENRGQEGASAGSAMALNAETDWVVQSYRELPVLLRQGMPLEQYWTLFIGHPDGWGFPEGVNVWPLQIELGAQMPHAVGMAWGFKRQQRPGVVVGYIGDGATSEGDFYEAGNLAGVTKAPVVFFVQNNGWAISTPRERQTAASSIAAKAAGWGMPSYIVDGNDVFAVYSVMREAVARARNGEGATLIEAQTYRVGAHNTSDAPSRYRTEDGADAIARTDPLVRLRTYATSLGLWDADRDAALTESTYIEIDEAFKVAHERAKVRTPSMLFDHVYADPPARTIRQRETIEKEFDQ
ncbi:pyruvate dehydrogenase E1 component alpha subunit [Arthrobacter sp. SLBN-100]|uniref:thiamine pyrophosphate-dependent enzyme n=1 Tax=Arthrobacter sp. SLBN-100 TaxID=2768450 RepID=UPI001168B734|nr:thiamine pyrophosphate-dependent enzyme [Arthrobacter sp. SLBN-100]TQJ62221.1 pyruvate dehydrogenase E1 component alpha subunit [Arthrobacter sp. SLBN-100]